MRNFFPPTAGSVKRLLLFDARMLTSLFQQTLMLFIQLKRIEFGFLGHKHLLP